MDYVLFGMGYGASLMLLGWALRTFGPQRKYAIPPKEEDPQFQVERRFWVRFIQGLGGVIAIVGTSIVLMTFVVVLVNPDDDVGSTIALAIWAFSMVALLLWCWMYVRHYGLTGIWSRQGGYGFRRSSGIASSPLRTHAPEATRVPTGKPLSGDEQPQLEAADADMVDAEAVNGETASDEVAIELETSGSELETNGPVTEEDAIYDFGDVGDTTVPSDTGGRGEALRRLQERQARARQLSPRSSGGDHTK